MTFLFKNVSMVINHLLPSKIFPEKYGEMPQSCVLLYFQSKLSRVLGSYLLINFCVKELVKGPSKVQLLLLLSITSLSKV